MATIRNLNNFPAENGMSDEFSPLSIVTGGPRADTRNHNLDVGCYVEVFEHDGWMQKSNRTRGATSTCLGPTPYRKASNYFMSLVTGRRLCRRKWSELTMPELVIDRVHFISQAQKQTFMPRCVAYQ